MVYLAELLVAMTDRLNIIRIRARSVPPTRTQALIDDDAFLASDACSRKATVSRADAPRCQSWCLSKKVVATVCPLHFDTKSEQFDCNKSSANTGFRTFRNLEHLRLTS